jgi:parallel beta-helix repeat protein
MNAITVHVGGTPVRVTPATPNIQTVLNNAAAGALILFEPGTYDKQLLIVPKPLRLQGSGPGSTFLRGVKAGSNKLVAWRTALDSLLGATPGTGVVDLLPSQEQAPGGVEPDTFNTEQGAVVTVLGRSDARCTGGNPPANCFRNNRAARIDGFTIFGGDSAGGIYVNGWAHYLQISNNIVRGNSGLFHGGVRVGVPFQQGLPGDGPFGYSQELRIHHNAITHNGGLGGAGGGVMLCTGTDGYQLTENWVCGNFTQGHGAGIAHFGMSDRGLIARNKILFNQSFNQGLTVHGGGLLVAGEPAVDTALTRGAGDVTVDANLILGNQTGAGSGAGIRTQLVNGMDVLGNRGQRGQWHVVRLTNNMVVNNVAGYAGGGISLQDSARVEIVNNTVAHNDSTATAGPTFISANESANQVAGLVSERHSPELAAAFSTGPATAPYRVYSNPNAFSNNIVWENRSFHYEVNAGQGSLLPALTPTAEGACGGGTPVFQDLGVIGGGTFTFASNSVLTPTNPLFYSAYCNGARSTLLVPGVTTIQTAPALDEGGNWIDVRYGPIRLTRGNDLDFFGNYHIQAGSPAANAGAGGAPTNDYDNQARTAPVDIGADEQVLPIPPLP